MHAPRTRFSSETPSGSEEKETRLDIIMRLIPRLIATTTGAAAVGAFVYGMKGFFIFALVWLIVAIFLFGGGLRYLHHHPRGRLRGG